MYIYIFRFKIIISLKLTWTDDHLTSVNNPNNPNNSLTCRPVANSHNLLFPSPPDDKRYFVFGENCTDVTGAPVYTYNI